MYNYETPTETRFEAMTTRERNQVNGRFYLVERTPEKLVIACIGTLWADDLTRAQLRHIKAWYGAADKPHEIVQDYPVKINRSMHNDYLIISR